MISIINRQCKVRIPRQKVTKLCAALLRQNGLARKTLNIVFVDNAEIRRINRQFLNHKGATDVIAFPLADAQDSVFGEIVVSAEKAQQEARARRIPVEHELLRYCVHGTLHLLGYQDNTPAKARKMWAVQEHFIRQQVKK